MGNDRRQSKRTGVFLQHSGSLMRMLFVTPFIGWPLREGGHIRLWNTLQALKPLGELDVVVFQPLHSEHTDNVFEGCAAGVSEE